ncbi:hypothetical protein [Streptomyces kronopolitis]|uniref:hypothetical protein n=1 Tax=Streptomyces kronopolitis TaxID=1612435 RepID=UPI0036C285CC
MAVGQIEEDIGQLFSEVEEALAPGGEGLAGLGREETESTPTSRVLNFFMSLLSQAGFWAY